MKGWWIYRIGDGENNDYNSARQQYNSPYICAWIILGFLSTERKLISCFVFSQILNVWSVYLCFVLEMLYWVIIFLFSLTCYSLAAHISQNCLLGGETVKQQALTGCWYPDVQHSSWHEGHSQWWVLSCCHEHNCLSNSLDSLWHKWLRREVYYVGALRRIELLRPAL